MKVLVTGSNGFVGNALVEVLHSKNKYSITPVVRSRGSYLLSNFEVLEVQDFTQSGIWEDKLDGIEVIVHTAGRAHVLKEKSKLPLEEYRKNNVSNTLILAEEAAKAGVKRFIFISSIKVNGEKTIHGQKFKPDDIPKPADYYAISKLEAEKSLFDLSSKTNMEIVCIRPPLIYGSAVKGNLALLVKFIRRGIPLPLGSINSNKRSLVSLLNLTDLIEVCLEHPKAANEVFLVSDGEDLSTSELILQLSKALEKPAHLLRIPMPLLQFLLSILRNERIADRLFSSLQVDITKTIELLDWFPKFTVEQGLKSIIEK